MGHEFVELKNTAAAIAAYRKAVDINDRDYRAWYGLGQTYELLTMPLYALYYYSKTCELRPYDARMWIAMGSCYALLGESQVENAITCYKRAEYNNDRDGLALAKLAKLYEQRQELDKAAYYYKKHLDRRDAEGSEGAETLEALLFLAQHCKARGNIEDAIRYATRLLDFTGQEMEEAKALLREIHAAKGFQTPQPSESPIGPSHSSNWRWGAEADDDILVDAVGGSPMIPISPIGSSQSAWQRRNSGGGGVDFSSIDEIMASPVGTNPPPPQTGSSMDMDME